MDLIQGLLGWDGDAHLVEGEAVVRKCSMICFGSCKHGGARSIILREREIMVVTAAKCSVESRESAHPSLTPAALGGWVGC